MIVHMIGNAHIDPVWLWPWQSGVDEALATLRSAADRCDEYPEFIFTRGEAWVYQQVERLDSELFARVRGLVARGQWHVVGGQYIQPDANLPTEMGWRRQFARGQRYFRERFGVHPRIAYNVDTFGHPATLPDMLASLGYSGYVFQRPSSRQVPLPAQTFRWRGPKGGDLAAFRITPSYVTYTDDLYEQIMLAVEAAGTDIGHTMCFYGVGNHGGGPTRANIEYILEHATAFPDVELRFSTPEAFFDAIAPHWEVLPVVRQELQHTFPGCYSVMHAIKQEQRHAEHLLDQCARVIDQLVPNQAAQEHYRQRLDAAWDDLLFTQFHDVLAGTSILSAYGSVRAMQGRARITGEEILVDATRRWAIEVLPPVDHQQIVTINPDEVSWSGLIEVEPTFGPGGLGSRWVSEMDGRPVEMQEVQSEAGQLVSRVLLALHVPARASKVLLLRDDERMIPQELPTDLDVSPRHIANGYLHVKLDDTGIRALSVGGRNVLGADGIRLHLRNDPTDTWGFHVDRFVEPVAMTLHADGWRVEESGPLRARVHMEGWLGRSRVRWTLSLQRGDPCLHLQCEVAFNERCMLLQMPVHLVAAPARWTDGMAAGCVVRSAGPVEWPVQGWSHVELAGAHLGLVTNDAYSLSLDQDRWQWTLLRSPKAAWLGEQPAVYAGRDRYTDQGEHVFRFVLHAGEYLATERLEAAARQLAQRPVVFHRYEGMAARANRR